MSSSVDIAVVVPVYNAVPYLRRCLEALAASSFRAAECIVVDDGSTDDVGEVARAHGAQLVRLASRGGPARARNAGVAACTKEVVLFLDADVCVHVDTLARIRDWFAGAEPVDAVFGSYDDSPAAPGLVSQYRNLLHCYTHQRAKRRASTFWAGCGAIRRQVFEKAGGFRESFDTPSIEDIELGYRLTDTGATIVIDSDIQVTHLKRWTLSSVVRTDVLSRGIPWAELMLGRRNVPDDLNLRVSQRLSTVLAWLLIGEACLAGSTWDARWLIGIPVVAGLLIALNADFYRFLAQRRGWLFAIAAMPLHWLYHIYNGVSFAVALVRHWRRGSTA